MTLQVSKFRILYSGINFDKQEKKFNYYDTEGKNQCTD